ELNPVKIGVLDAKEVTRVLHVSHRDTRDTKKASAHAEPVGWPVSPGLAILLAQSGGRSAMRFLRCAVRVGFFVPMASGGLVLAEIGPEVAKYRVEQSIADPRAALRGEVNVVGRGEALGLEAAHRAAASHGPPEIPEGRLELGGEHAPLLSDGDRWL